MRILVTYVLLTGLALTPGTGLAQPAPEETTRRLPPLPDLEEPPKPIPAEGPQATTGPTAKPPVQPTMREDLERSFRKLATLRNNEALRHFETGDYPRALAALKAAYDLNAQDPEIVNNLAYVLQLLGNRDEAIPLYRKAIELDPERYAAHINLADLLMEAGRNEVELAEAARFLVRARELSGNKPTVILRQARVAARRGRFHEAELCYRELLMHQEEADRRRLEVGDFYRDFGRTEIAARVYREVPADSPHHAAAQERLWHLAAEAEARRFGWLAQTGEVPVEARELLARARALVKQRNDNGAIRLLEEALARAPQYSEARLLLADIHRDAGRRDQAELTYLQALAFDSRNAEIHLRLGDLYLDEVPMVRAAEAVLFLTSAQQLRPEWTGLHLRLARACQATGRLHLALDHVTRFLDTHPAPGERAEAEAIRRALEQGLATGADGAPETPEVTAHTGAEAALPAQYHVARSHLAHDRPAEAMAALAAIAPEDRFAPVLVLEGRLLEATGRVDQAMERYREALALDDSLLEVHEVLASLYEARHEETAALTHYRRAADLGSRQADYYLVRLELEAGRQSFLAQLAGWLDVGRLLRWRRQLRGYLQQGPEALHYHAASELADRVENRLVTLTAGAALFLVLLVLLGWWLWHRSRGGSGLLALIRAHPEAGPEVQRVLAAIRHEVLKHNTLILAGLVDRLEAGQEAAAEAGHLRETLFGERRAEGIYAQFLVYCDQLRQIGRAHGVRLNLRRRDPALGAILEGFARLQRCARALDRVEILTPGGRKRLVRSLKEAGRLLNVEGYEQVRTLLDRLRVLVVDEPLLQGIAERITREPKFAARTLPPIRFASHCPLPQAVFVPRSALEDVLGNLVRNALNASLQEEEPPPVALSIDCEEDPITLLENVVFATHDQSPQPLTTEMIRGRYVSSGLGLCADLVARYEGTIDVVTGEAPWRKAVVVKFPKAELPGPEEAEKNHE